MDKADTAHNGHISDECVSTAQCECEMKGQFLVVSKAYNSTCYRLGCSYSAAAAHLDLTCSAHLQRKLSSPLIRDLGRLAAILSVKCLLRTWQTHTTRTTNSARSILIRCCRLPRRILAGALRILQCGERYVGPRRLEKHRSSARSTKYSAGPSASSYYAP
jgi:hypothetical protein